MENDRLGWTGVGLIGSVVGYVYSFFFSPFFDEGVLDGIGGMFRIELENTPACTCINISELKTDFLELEYGSMCALSILVLQSRKMIP